MNEEQRIFDEALGKPVSDRVAYLDQACAANSELRTRVEVLLAAHDRAGAFMDAPPTGLLADDWAAASASADRPGTTVGPYKLLEQIGEGGMGVVFIAEQLRPVRRKVALKLIKPGLDTKEVIARFEAERQALAMMDHPNIAKVFDAGSTDTGRPYFVMELVRGVPITQYCDEQKLEPRQRLELFAQVCHAVQHAHTKGVIHRDLKPTNVLVTLNDGDRPVPKVIDFGIAKATAGQRLTEQTLYTEFRQLVGTPLYMSPEQAEMSALLDVDTRSDVYSLGVLLYELLTGTTPFDKQRLAKAAYDEVRRIIREEEPPRPSTRISTLGDTLASVSAQRHTDPKKLGGIVRGELDWIVMRALEKDRTRRYETAIGLAHDVERYLADQPVQACPPSRTYRLRKLVRRNKAAMATATLVLAVLIAATGVSSWQAIRANRARIETRREADKQEAVNQFLNDMLGSASTLDRTVADPHRGPDVTMREVVASAARKIEAGSFKDRPELEAAVRRTLALVFFNTQQTEKARAYMRTALDLNRQVYGLDHPATADCMFRLGYWIAGTEGERMMRDGLAVQRKHLGDNNITVVNSMCQLAHVLRGTGKVPESEAISRRALAIREKLPPDLLPPVSGPLYQLARSLSAQKRYAEAEPLLRRAVEVQRRVRGESSGQPVSFVWHLVEVLINQGKTAEAEPMLRELVAADPANFEASSRLIDLLLAQSKAAEADRMMDELVAALKRVPDPVARIGTAGWSAGKLGVTLQGRGKLGDAEWLYRHALTAYRKQNGDLWNTAKLFGYLIDVLREQGKVAEAQVMLRESLPVYQAAVADQRKKEGETARLGWILTTYAERLHADGQFGEAEKHYREGLTLRRKKLGEEAVEVSWSLGSLAAALEAQGKTADIEALWRERLAYWQNQLTTADTPERRAQIHLRMFASLKSLGQFEQAKESCRAALALNPTDAAAFQAFYGIAAELSTVTDPARQDLGLAEALYRQSLVIKRKTDGDETPDMFILLDRLAEVLRAQGKSSEAEFEALWRERLQSWQKELDNAATPPERRTLICLTRARLLMYCGQPDKVEESCRKAIESNPTAAAATALNDLSWALSTSADPTRWDPSLAVDLAAKAAELRPGEWGFWNTLGVARYRNGDFKRAVMDFEKSIALAGYGDSSDFFFLAMAHYRLGDAKVAREWYDKGVAGLRRHAPHNEELLRFRAEAEQVLGEKPAAAASRRSSSSKRGESPVGGATSPPRIAEPTSRPQ